MNIAVLFGGISPERNVSINGGKAVCRALKSLGHHVFSIDPAYGTDCLIDIENLEIPNRPPTKEELAKFDKRNYIDCINSPVFDDIDVAFIVLHGENGEDGKIQALLEMRGIKYTGSNIKASALAIDKNSSKMMFTAAGIITPPWGMINKADIGNFDYYKSLRDDFGGEMVIKPNDQGSSIGVTIINDGNLDDIGDAIVEAFKYSDSVIVEKFIEGREITVPIIGDEAYPVIEILPEDGFYDYSHKYSKGKSNYICPAEMTEDIEEFIQTMAESAFSALGCSGFARADFRLTDESQPFLMEMNTIPGFTATSLVPMSAKLMGIEFPELCQRIIDIALGVVKDKEEQEEEV